MQPVSIDAVRLTEALRSASAKKVPYLIAIDGPSCSGKSTFGQQLAKALGAALFHMDDFYLQTHQRTEQRLAEPGGNVDRERFLSEVLLPLSSGLPFVYRPFDCQTMSVTAGTAIPACSLAVIEGSYALHPELSPYYDCRILLSISPEEQRRRVYLRESAEKAPVFLGKWIPLENHYFRETAIETRADYIVKND